MCERSASGWITHTHGAYKTFPTKPFSSIYFNSFHEIRMTIAFDNLFGCVHTFLVAAPPPACRTVVACAVHANSNFSTWLNWNTFFFVAIRCSNSNNNTTNAVIQCERWTLNTENMEYVRRQTDPKSCENYWSNRMVTERSYFKWSAKHVSFGANFYTRRGILR